MVLSTGETLLGVTDTIFEGSFLTAKERDESTKPFTITVPVAVVTPAENLLVIHLI